jgi:hypothetical protein
MWQLTQVSGLSPKYECAFDSRTTNKPNPQNMPNKMITGKRQLSGGIMALIKFLILVIDL